jgi:hypothetical protein
MTTQKIVIRDKTEADVAAFETMATSSHTEQFIIEALRSARALTFDGHFPQGAVMFHEGLKANGQQGASPGR